VYPVFAEHPIQHPGTHDKGSFAWTEVVRIPDVPPSLAKTAERLNSRYDYKTH